MVDNDRGWRALLKSVETMAEESYAKVGVLADDTKGSFRETGADPTVAEIAVLNEFGTDTAPARPFLGTTFDAVRDDLIRVSTKGVGAILDGKASVGFVLDSLGAKLAAETKKAITTTPLPGIPPPNAPSTMLAKAMTGRTKRFFKARTSKNEGRNFATALAQAGALASVRTLVDTGRMVNAITWHVIKGDSGQVVEDVPVRVLPAGVADE